MEPQDVVRSAIKKAIDSNILSEHEASEILNAFSKINDPSLQFELSAQFRQDVASLEVEIESSDEIAEAFRENRNMSGALTVTTAGTTAAASALGAAGEAAVNIGMGMTGVGFLFFAYNAVKRINQLEKSRQYRLLHVKVQALDNTAREIARRGAIQNG